MQHRDLLIRSILGFPCLIIAYWLFQRAGGGYMGMLSVFPCMAAFALIIFPSLTTSMASVWQGIYMPERSEKPKPYITRALTLRSHHLPLEAMAEYEDQITIHPEDQQLWTAALEIAWLDLEDRDLAASLHRRALRATRGPEAWRRIHQLHLHHAERHPDAEEWLEEEKRLAERRLRLRMQMR